jgi:hypothetical protein
MASEVELVHQVDVIGEIRTRREVQQREISGLDQAHTHGVLDEASPTISSEVRHITVHARHTALRKLLADVVKLAVEASQCPSKPLRSLAVRRNANLAGIRVEQHRLSERCNQTELIGRHGHSREGDGLLAVNGHRRDVDASNLAQRDGQLVRASPGMESDESALEVQRTLRTGSDREERCTIAIGHVQDNARPCVLEPPEPICVGEYAEHPMQVRILVDDEICGPAEREQLFPGYIDDSTAKLDSEIEATFAIRHAIPPVLRGADPSVRTPTWSNNATTTSRDPVR